MTVETHFRSAGEPPSVREVIMGGIGAGVLAGSLMMAALILNSLMRRQVWWMLPNVLGSTFYGGRALRSGAGLVTLSGLALHLLISGLIGGIFGFLCLRVLKTRRFSLFALFVTMLWYFLAYQLIWTRVNPFVPLYASEPSTAIAHAVFALTMGRSLRGFLPEASRAEDPNSPQVLVESPAEASDRPAAPGPLEASAEPPSRPIGDGLKNQTAPEGPVRLE